MLLLAAGAVARADVPVPTDSPRIDAIKQRGTLRVGVLAEPPWLKQNLSGSGEPFSGPAWMLATSVAKRLGVTVDPVPVSHETKVPILATGQVDMTIAPLSVTPQREKVVDFVVYSKSVLCFFGKSDNPKLKGVTTVDALNVPAITVAYFTGTPPEAWLPERLPRATLRGVGGSGANAPVEEIMSGRGDVAPIDAVAWYDLAKKISGLTSIPPGDDCIRSTELPTAVGLAVDKQQDKFRDFVAAVEREMHPALEAEELRIVKE